MASDDGDLPGEKGVEGRARAAGSARQTAGMTEQAWHEKQRTVRIFWICVTTLGVAMVVASHVAQVMESTSGCGS